MLSKQAIVKGKSFSTLFISSWKYAGACSNPQGTFGYSYYPKDVKAVLGIESSYKGMKCSMVFQKL